MLATSHRVDRSANFVRNPVVSVGAPGDDATVIARSLSDSEAFATIFERHFDEIHRYLRRRHPQEADELAAGHALRPATTTTRVMAPADVATLKRGDYERPAAAPARFTPGDRVRTVNINPPTHTRLPRYARDKEGVIEAVRGCHVYPDTAAIGAGDDPQWLYTVVFSGRELWGSAADPTLTVLIEAFEPYLVPA